MTLHLRNGPPQIKAASRRICYVRRNGKGRHRTRELRASLSSTRHRHHRRFGGSYPHRRASDQGAQERRLQGCDPSRQSQVSGAARPQVLSRRRLDRRAVRPCHRCRAGAGGGPVAARLRQGCHSFCGGADGRLPRDGGRRARTRGAAEAGHRRERRTRRRPQLPGHAVPAVARLCDIRQRRRRDRVPPRQRVVRVPVRRLRLCRGQHGGGPGRGLSLLRLLRQ